MSGRLASRWRGRHDPLMEVADGIFKIDGVRIANVYLVATEDGLLLVDTGMPGNARRILSFIEGMGRKPSDLRDIVLTHCDIDHIGSAAELKRLTGARVAIHELDAPVLSGQQRPQKGGLVMLSLIHISEPTRLGMISYAVF